jgi:sulfate adenylyltransferase
MTLLEDVTQIEAAPIAPHGGRLIDRIARGADAEALRGRAARLPRLQLTARQLSDLHLIANGAFSPLTGFMGSRDYRRVVQEMRLANGLPWSIPVTLAVAADDAPAAGAEVALYDPEGTLRGVMRVDEAYGYDKEAEARNVYGTADAAHPGVAVVYAQGDVLLGGEVSVLDVQEAAPHEYSPAQARAAFAERGWRTVVGFQTRNPVHRAHEYIQKCALETVDGLLLHPLVGETKSDDIPADVRMRCYEVLLAGYYPKDRVLLAVLPAAMRYAGPREAIFHALIRKNYGCTHFIVGRDHAGVGSYYGTYDAQKLFERFSPEELGITPVKFENSFYCRRCDAMATAKTCPHDASEHVALSGTAVRNLLRSGQYPPPEFSRPEVAQILVEAMRENGTGDGNGPTR